MKSKYLYIIIFIIGCTAEKTKLKTEYELSKDTLYFKNLNFTDTLRRIVFFKNNSERAIKILKIETGCGCTSALLSDSVAKGNDSIPIRITYIPAKVGDSGNVTKYMTVRSDAEIPFKNLIIKGNIGK